MPPEFTAHNIRLDNGIETRPETGFLMGDHVWCAAAKRMLESLFPGDKSQYRLADLGCLEGGYAVEFARMGFQVVGVEVRESNMEACRYVKANVDLPNLQFVRDDAWNVAKYGPFDVMFCCGLLYHLDRPKQFLQMLSEITTRVLILQTHFSMDTGSERRRSGGGRLARTLARAWSGLFHGKPKGDASSAPTVSKFNVSAITENEGLRGRWYTEFASEADFGDRETKKWASRDNRRSFWVQREYLLQTIQDVGFDLVLEQFDSLGQGNIADSMVRGFYKTDTRGTFLGIKTSSRVALSAQQSLSVVAQSAGNGPHFAKDRPPAPAPAATAGHR